MEKLKFSVRINAVKEKVWQVLWDDTSYREWSSAFTEGSHAVTDNWKEGTKVLFLNPNRDGIVSTVAVNKPYEFMSFKHLGMVKNGEEDTVSEPVKSWAGMKENYRLNEIDGKTELQIEMDSTGEFNDCFNNTWPKALEKIKEMSETRPVNITVQTTVNAPVEKVWACWSGPEHIIKWNHAADDWHTTAATNELRAGGQFSYRMEAKDGSFGFDFGGTYDEVENHKLIAYTLGDGRRVKINFTPQGAVTNMVETFEAEETHTIEQQRSGWQLIMNNFKKYTETN